MTEQIVRVENVSHVYKSHHEGIEDVKALSDINLSIENGQFVVIIGRNGSDKSTFARLINALLLPTEGEIYFYGIRTDDEKHLWNIRSSAGMVFQNPDNQIVGTTVEEDVAFGPENLGVDPDEIVTRVQKALECVGILDYSKNAPHLLSGGQKQRVAIAGILAMKPKCIILDEATSMLDPAGRKEVMDVLWRLNREENITIIHITHHMEEAVRADRVIIINSGVVAIDGNPGEVFSNVSRVKALGLDVPQVTELFYELNLEGYNLPSDILEVEDAYRHLADRISRGG